MTDEERIRMDRDRGPGAETRGPEGAEFRPDTPRPGWTMVLRDEVEDGWSARKTYVYLPTEDLLRYTGGARDASFARGKDAEIGRLREDRERLQALAAVQRDDLDHLAAELEQVFDWQTDHTWRAYVSQLREIAKNPGALTRPADGEERP